jgi:hypothetical protein
MQGALLVDRDGKVVNEMSGDAFGHRVGEDVEIVRGTLCQILMDHISDAEFVFGDSIQAISQSSDGVHVEFTRISPQIVLGDKGEMAPAPLGGRAGAEQPRTTSAFAFSTTFFQERSLPTCARRR